MSEATSNGDASARVAFDYIKSQLFRVVRADGVIGGLTPNGHVHMAFFSERPAIPRRQVFQLTPEGTLGEMLPNETVSRDSIVREMDVDVFMTIDTAKLLYAWLDEKIRAATAPIIAPQREERN